MTLNFQVVNIFNIPERLKEDSGGPRTRCLSSLDPVLYGSLSGRFFFFFFFMWTIFKFFIKFVTASVYYVWVFWPQGTWDLSSLTRGGT